MTSKSWRVAALLFSLSCQRELPVRPPGVPANAVWAGGPDGGRWVSCSTVGETNNCVVYNDHTGEVEMQGSFVLADTRRAASETELVFEGSPDGTSIHLRGGKRLVPVK